MRFLARRLLFYLLAFFAAVTLNFLLPRLMPGSPLDGLILRYGEAIRNNPDVLKQLEASLGGADDPIWSAYPKYLANTFTGNLGVSTANQVPVTEVIRNTLPWSIFLVGMGFVLSFVVGTFLGAVAAWRRGGFVDTVGTPTLMALLSFPAFFLSLLAVYFLGFRLAWFPTQHAYSIDVVPAWSWEFVGDAFRHAQLPILVIVALSVGGWMLGMRNVMITTVQEDYVTMAQAKGLPDHQVMTGYAARNAILPPLTAFASFFASAVGGLILVEVVFSYPGVGLTLQQAALGHDYPVVQALLLVISFCVLLANFIMDCVYVVLDPRVRAS
ncbi:MAG TPA: ABC transporter permease [Gaiella sp.]|jgi:peptide/nickel transport system permease protein|nr:ABC transporter permease [Gaiella sp.]